jgi:hypothetical protein
LLGCTTEPSTALPDGAEAFVPPAEYQGWWASTEGCADIQGNFGRIKWYVVPGVSTFPTEEGEKVGIRIKTGNDVRIVLANYVEARMVVRHEMLHACSIAGTRSSSGCCQLAKRGRVSSADTVPPAPNDQLSDPSRSDSTCPAYFHRLGAVSARPSPSSMAYARPAQPH